MRVFRAATVSGRVSADPSFSDCRRARFQSLRARDAYLRARLASRFASFKRLRALRSSSFASRTRCRATSACSWARSMTSADSDWTAGASSAEAVSDPVFFMALGRSEPSVSHDPPRLATAHCTGSVTLSYPQNLCITMWTDPFSWHKEVMQPRVCVGLIILSPCWNGARSFGRSDGRIGARLLPVRLCRITSCSNPVASGVLTSV